MTTETTDETPKAGHPKIVAALIGLLDDAPSATRMLAETSRVLKLIPDAIVLGEWIAETALSIETVSASAQARRHFEGGRISYLRINQA